MGDSATSPGPAVSVVLVIGPPTPAPPPALAGARAAVERRADAELIVVEDGQPAVRTALLELRGRVRVAHPLPHVGARGALAEGVRLAGGSVVAIVDPAAELPDGWLDAMTEPFAGGDPGVGVVVAGRSDGAEAPDPLGEAAVVALRRVAIESIGGPAAFGTPRSEDDAPGGGLLGNRVAAALRGACWRVRTARLALDVVAATESWPPGTPIALSRPAWSPPVLPKMVRPGLNVIGLLEAACGIGDAGRRYAEAIERAGVASSTFAFHGHSSPEAPFTHRGDGQLSFDTNLLVINPDLLPLFAMCVGAELWVGRYTIGIWFWELETLPTRHLGALDYVNELWASSRFITDCLGRATDKPVVTVPLPVRHRTGRPTIARAETGLPDRFTFLSTFDFGSIAARKNGLGAVEAFCRAFSPGEGPALVVKTLNARADRVGADQLNEAVAGRPDITVVDRYLSDEAMSAMVGHAECYVSLHRSEGFGLSLAEAMAWGRPVVATAYSGNTDYMTDENSYLVPYELVAVPSSLSTVYPPTARWAEPSIDDAARRLRQVWEHPEAADARGARAQLDIRRTHSSEAAARAVAARLQALGRGPRVTRNARRPSAPPRPPDGIAGRRPALTGRGRG
ncbi:MAG TPA: glycosyltransferase [Acidimicrobiales bacterium]|nr:glycosyltransferase [Acidimicrobiales bacterium]